MPTIQTFRIHAECACGRSFRTRWNRVKGFSRRQCLKCKKAGNPQRTIHVTMAEPLDRIVFMKDVTHG